MITPTWLDDQIFGILPAPDGAMLCLSTTHVPEHPQLPVFCLRAVWIRIACRGGSDDRTVPQVPSISALAVDGKDLACVHKQLRAFACRDSGQRIPPPPLGRR